MLNGLFRHSKLGKGAAAVLLGCVCTDVPSVCYPQSIVTGPYCNSEYGYCVAIPHGLVATTNPTPLPQHGFRISLSTSLEAYVWVDGSYNASDWASAEQALDVDLEFLKKEAVEVTPLNRTALYLGRLPAVRSTVRFKDSKGEVIIQDLAIAIRLTGADTNIVYTVGLRTSESRYQQDEQIFRKLMAAWKLSSLRR